MKHILFNPFEKYPDRVLIPFGLFFSVVGIIFGYIFNARYDGIIDLHFVEKVNIYQPIFEICVNIFCAFFHGGGTVSRRKSCRFLRCYRFLRCLCIIEEL